VFITRLPISSTSNLKNICKWRLDKVFVERARKGYGGLAQGDEANEFAIKDSDGKTYGLRSSKVNLKQHPGHQVSVTGTPAEENKARKNAKVNQHPGEKRASTCR
jgi:hypothetical protein